MYSHKIPEWSSLEKRIQNKKKIIFTEYQSGWLALASQSKSPNVPKWVKMSLVFSWRVIIPALTQLLFQFEWTVTDIFCSRWRDEYESSFLIILESLKSHLHLRPKEKKKQNGETKQKIYTKVWRKLLPLSFRPQRILLLFLPESIC